MKLYDKKKINKEDILLQICSETKLPLNQVRETVNVFIDEIVDAVSSDCHVNIKGFGVFYPHDRKIRKGRNATTGEVLIIPPKRVLRFKPSREVMQDLRD